MDLIRVLVALHPKDWRRRVRYRRDHHRQSPG